ATMLGKPLFVIALVGIVSRLGSGSSQRHSYAKWTAPASLLLALWFFHSILYPVSDSRYLLAAAPALLLFAAAGSEEITRWLSSRMRMRYVSTLAGIVVITLTYSVSTFRVENKKHYGWSELAAALTRRFGDSAHFVLVSGPPTSEGMLVSEMALLDRP